MAPGVSPPRSLPSGRVGVSYNAQLRRTGSARVRSGGAAQPPASSTSAASVRGPSPPGPGPNPGPRAHRAPSGTASSTARPLTSRYSSPDQTPTPTRWTLPPHRGQPLPGTRATTAPARGGAPGGPCAPGAPGLPLSSPAPARGGAPGGPCAPGAPGLPLSSPAPAGDVMGRLTRWPGSREPSPGTCGLVIRSAAAPPSGKGAAPPPGSVWLRRSAVLRHVATGSAQTDDKEPLEARNRRDRTAPSHSVSTGPSRPVAPRSSAVRYRTRRGTSRASQDLIPTRGAGSSRQARPQAAATRAGSRSAPSGSRISKCTCGCQPPGPRVISTRRHHPSAPRSCDRHHRPHAAVSRSSLADSDVVTWAGSVSVTWTHRPRGARRTAARSRAYSRRDRRQEHTGHARSWQSAARYVTVPQSPHRRTSTVRPHQSSRAARATSPTSRSESATAAAAALCRPHVV